MTDDYDPIQKAQDATRFAESRFGQHYLKRLAEVRDGHYRQARTLLKEGQPESQIIAAIARADEADGELAYFAQAREIATDRKLMDRIRENIKKRLPKAKEEE